MITELSNDIANAVAAAAPSVVQVAGRRRPASGLVYENDLVLTMMSALGRQDGLRVVGTSGDPIAAELLGWDPATGLGVLRAPGLGLKPLAAATAPVRVGHIGVAVCRSWSNSITASAGIVAVIGGPLATGSRRAIDQVYRTTAPMHDGFAGGAFLDASGSLIGVATARSIRGFGVIIPASIAWKAAASALEHGRTRRGYLGVAGQSVELPDHQRGDSNRQRGMLMLAVTSGSPAASAGVLVGDVLLSINGVAIESPEELLDVLMTIGAGGTAHLQLLRGGVVKELDVSAGERPA